eukprot:6178199-Pleurochrysis_carterae.AAC.1
MVHMAPASPATGTPTSLPDDIAWLGAITAKMLQSSDPDILPTLQFRALCLGLYVPTSRIADQCSSVLSMIVPTIEESSRKFSHLDTARQAPIVASFFYNSTITVALDFFPSADNCIPELFR